MERPIPSSIPTTPGVYLYRDAAGTVIYVGKAINLRKRVLSYFRQPESLPRKTVAMLARAVSIETLSTSTEKEALLLESSLIKKYRPHYNIVLRDDKQYVLFRLARNTPFPRLEVVRSVRKDHARYFGPFTSGLAARETLKTLHRLFPLRRCTDRAMASRLRPCLYHDMGRCLAPCTGRVDQFAYAAMVQRVEMLLSGRSRELLHALRQEMMSASDALEFEKAAALRDQIRAVEQTVEKQHVVLNDGGDMDVAGVSAVCGGLGLGLLFVREGKLMDRRTFFWSGLALEDGPDTLWSFLGQYYSTLASAIPPRIIVPWQHNGEEEGSEEGAFAQESLEAALTALRMPEGEVRVRLPKNAAESALVDLAAENAREDALKKAENPLAERLQAALRSKGPISRLECVDVSHTGDKATRVGMVVFENERPVKNDYRNYAIEGADGDDYAALSIWAERRLAEGEPWPDLLLIDGGKGQIAAVDRAFREGLKSLGGDGALPFALAGIAKARDEEGRADRRAGNVSDRIFVPGRSNPLPLKEGSGELLFLQHVRDTTHRFAIGRHRRARSREALESELTRIPGVGPALARRLWDHFGSLEAMCRATPGELAAVPGVGAVTAAKLAEKFQRLFGDLAQAPGSEPSGAKKEGLPKDSPK